MIKVQNNIATRDPIPQFLLGLAPESLADLSWTDPALGVSDCAWWPEEDQSPPLGVNEKYEGETLTIDAETQTVTVTRTVVPMTAEEITSARKALVPASITPRQGLLILNRYGLLTQVRTILDSLTGTEGEEARIDFERASEWRRDWPLLNSMAAVVGLSEDQVDQMFIDGKAL